MHGVHYSVEHYFPTPLFPRTYTTEQLRSHAHGLPMKLVALLPQAAGQSPLLANVALEESQGIPEEASWHNALFFTRADVSWKVTDALIFWMHQPQRTFILDDIKKQLSLLASIAGSKPLFLTEWHVLPVSEKNLDELAYTLLQGNYPVAILSEFLDHVLCPAKLQDSILKHLNDPKDINVDAKNLLLTWISASSLAKKLSRTFNSVLLHEHFPNQRLGLVKSIH